MFARISLLSVFSLFLSLALAPSPASAQSFSPTNTTTTLSGFLNIQTGTNDTCQVSVDVSIDANGQATVTGKSLFPGSLNCGILVTPFGTWALSPDSTTAVTATIGFSGFPTFCSSDVTAVWDNANSSLSFFNVTILEPPNEFCIINGALFADPAITIVP